METIKYSELFHGEDGSRQFCLGKSLAGHDKGEIFVIIREQGEYFYLADGKNRTISRPKKKKKKHLQVIQAGQEQADRKLSGEAPVSDVEIKTFIKNYKKKTAPCRLCFGE